MYIILYPFLILLIALEVKPLLLRPSVETALSLLQKLSAHVPRNPETPFVSKKPGPPKEKKVGASLLEN